jgi:hypothetical protein
LLTVDGYAIDLRFALHSERKREREARI